MLLQSLGSSLLHVCLFTFCAGLIAPSVANAISISGNLSWTGDGGNSLTGIFTGEDANGDGIIQAVSSVINEFTVLTVTLTDTNSPLFQSYGIDQLLGFGTLNFNYDIDNSTVLQSLNPTDLLQGSAPFFSAGLSIGDGTSGFILESSNGSGLFFTDNINSNNDSGGTLNASPVPLESDALPIIGSLVFFGMGVWVKRKLKS